MREKMPLAGLLLLLLLSALLLTVCRRTAPRPYAGLMRDAAVRTERAFAAVKTERLARNIPLNEAEDWAQTGLIGENYTEITTTLGNPEAKRSSCNPNVAALFVVLFEEAGLKRNDTVAVNLSGSFPAMNLALLCAMDAYGLKGTVIASVGASSYGANLPDFTYPDIEYAVQKQGYLGNHTTYFSLGGQEDLGLEMPEDLRAAIRTRLSALGYEYIGTDSWELTLERREQIYFGNDAPRCLINVGGNLLSFGKGSQMSSAMGGLLTKLPAGEKGDGLIPLFLRRRLPVIHILNLKDLFARYGLPVDPLPLPPAGEGDIYLYRPYSRPLAAALLLLNAAAFVWVFRKGKRHRRK